MYRFAFIFWLFIFPAMSTAAATTPETYRIASDRLIIEGEALLEEGRDDDALKRFEAALVADPGSIRALIRIGGVHDELGRKEVGLRFFRRARDVDPANREALLAEGLALLRAEDIAGARANEERLSRICGAGGCSELQALRAALPANEEQ